MKRFRCDDGRGEYNNMTFRYVLAAQGTTYEPCSPYAHHNNGVAERMICTITEKARAMIIDSQAPVLGRSSWYHSLSPSEITKRRPEKKKCLLWLSSAVWNAIWNVAWFWKTYAPCRPQRNIVSSPSPNLPRFGCYVSRLILEVQPHVGKFSPSSKPGMMVGYTHNSKSLWRIWDPEFQRVKTQSEVIFDEERNAHMSCQHGSNGIDMFGLPEDDEYVEGTDTRDEPLRDSQPTQIGKRFKSPMHEAPDEETDNAHSWLLSLRGSDCPPFGSKCRKHHSQPAPPQRGSDCPALGSSNQAIKPSTASNSRSSSSSSSSSADRELCHKKSRYKLHRSTNGIRSNCRSIHLRGSHGKPSMKSLQRSHGGRKHLDPAQ